MKIKLKIDVKDDYMEIYLHKGEIVEAKKIIGNKDNNGNKIPKGGYRIPYGFIVWSDSFTKIK
jgi:hypothetical protein